MVILSDYDLVFEENMGVFVETSVVSHICPICKGMLKYRDARKRICRKEGGVKEVIKIRRFRCDECCSYHNELPDCLVPFKHYATEVISGVLDQVISADDLESEDFPSYITMMRWLQWLNKNIKKIEAYMKRIWLIVEDSTIEFVRRIYPKWLERIIYMIYNSGDALRPI